MTGDVVLGDAKFFEALKSDSISATTLVEIGSQDEFIAKKTDQHLQQPFLRSKFGFTIADGAFFSPVISQETHRVALLETLFPTLANVFIKDIAAISNHSLKLSIAQGAYLRSSIIDLTQEAGQYQLKVTLLFNFPSDVCSSNARYAAAIEAGLKEDFGKVIGFKPEQIEISFYQGGSNPNVEEMNCGSENLNKIFYSMLQGVRGVCGSCPSKIA